MVVSISLDVHRLDALNTALIDRALGSQPIDAGDFGLFAAMSALGPATVSDLSEFMVVPLPTVSKAISLAEQSGHVVRAKNPDDGRSQIIDFTADGERAYAAARDEYMKSLAALLGDLGGVRDDVRWALRRLEAAYLAVLHGDKGDVVGKSPERTLSYEGRPLSRDQEQLVRDYIGFIQWQDN